MNIFNDLWEKHDFDGSYCDRFDEYDYYEKDGEEEEPLEEEEELDEFSGVGGMAGAPGGEWVTKEERDAYNKKINKSVYVKGK